MNLKIIIATLICFLCFEVYTQNSSEEYLVGSSLSIKSEIMGDERKIQIFLPNDYADSNITYPVLYILDGQRYFLHGVSLQKSFLEFKQTPEFIIVGISKNTSDRNRNYTTNSYKYLDFIEKEVIDYVDNQFKTSEKRMFFGWAFGGGFVIETMLKKPNLFDAYISASPFPLKEKLSSMDSLFRRVPKLDKFLFFSSETNEGMVIEGTTELNVFLKDNAPKLLNWTFMKLPNEEHRSTPFTTLYHGIKKYFKYYPELQFNSLEEFSNAGGLTYVYDYYQKRASKFGLSSELSDWTMFSLTRNAIRASDYKQFDTLINEFKKTEFISRLSLRRAASIAEFYLENKQYNKAIDLFMFLVEKYPKSKIPLNRLGDIHTELKEERKATQYYKKAKKISDND